MLAYCNNNPINYADSTGTLAVAAVLALAKKAAIGAVINLATSYLAATITGQSFTLRDGCWAAVAGAGSGIHPALGGAIGGIYAAYSSYENGVDTAGIIVSGVTSFCCTAFCVGSFSKYVEGVAAPFVDAIFTFASNAISAATYAGISKKTTKTPQSNVIAIPWSNPNYSPTYSNSVNTSNTTSSISRRNTVACPWMYPDFST